MKRSTKVATLIILVGGLLANLLRYSGTVAEEPVRFDLIPLTHEGLIGVEERFSEQSYEILKADTTLLRRYIDSSGHSIWLFVGYFASQEYGSQIHSPKNCLPGGGWRIEQIDPFPLSLGGRRPREVNRVIISDRIDRQVMLYWYETRGGFIRGEFGLKFDLMLNALMFRPTDAAILRVNLAIHPEESVNEATARLVAYLESFYPSIQHALPFSQ